MMLLEKSTLLDPWTSPHSAPTGCRRELERRARSRIHPSPPLPDGGEKWTRRRLRLRVRAGAVRLRVSGGKASEETFTIYSKPI